MIYQRNSFILTGALTLMLNMPAFGQDASALPDSTVQFSASIDGKSFQDSSKNVDMKINQRTATQAIPAIETQPDINKTISSALYTKRPDELLNQNVHNSNEDVIGKVEAVVTSRQDGQVNVVIAKGGFMGIGATDYIVPLQDLSMNEGTLYLRSASAMNREYKQEGYVRIEPENQPISEFSAFEERQ